MWNLGPGRPPKTLINYTCARVSTLHCNQNTVRAIVSLCKLITKQVKVLQSSREGEVPHMKHGPDVCMGGFSIDLPVGNLSK